MIQPVKNRMDAVSEREKDEPVGFLRTPMTRLALPLLLAGVVASSTLLASEELAKNAAPHIPDGGPYSPPPTTLSVYQNSVTATPVLNGPHGLLDRAAYRPNRAARRHPSGLSAGASRSGKAV
jgi:hypothetical protein